jgi:hypothetical protein
MSEILIEPIKSMLDVVAGASTELCNSGKSSIPVIGDVETPFALNITLHKDENTMAIYLKNDKEVYYKKVVSINDYDSELDAETVLYGAMLTELMSTYAAVIYTMKQFKMPILTSISDNTALPDEKSL